MEQTSVLTKNQILESEIRIVISPYISLGDLSNFE